LPRAFGVLGFDHLTALLRMGRVMVELYCASFCQVPKRIVLDIDDTFDAVHGCQQLRLFNAHYDEYGFQPIVVFDGDGPFRKLPCYALPSDRKARRSGLSCGACCGRSGPHWPSTKILLCGDGHHCCPEVLDWCRAYGID
jgi:hypothetical protein